MSMMSIRTNRRVAEGASWGEKASKYLPAAIVALYTALNGTVSAATGLSDPTLNITRWSVWGVMVAVTLAYLIWNNTQADADEKISPLQIAWTLVTYTVWSAHIGGVLRNVQGWNVLFEQLALAFVSGVVPLFTRP